MVRFSPSLRPLSFPGLLHPCCPLPRTCCVSSISRGPVVTQHLPRRPIRPACPGTWKAWRRQGYSSGSLPPIPAQPLTGGDEMCSQEHSREAGTRACCWGVRHARRAATRGRQDQPGQPRGLFSTKLHRDRRKGRSNSRLGHQPRGWHNRGSRQEPAQEGN